MFVERVCNSSPTGVRPDRISVLVSRVQPLQCASLLKVISKRAFSREEKSKLAHLRRVRRFCASTKDRTKETGTSREEVVSQLLKKQRTNDGSRDETTGLEVLLTLAEGTQDDETSEWLQSLEHEFKLLPEARCVPGRSASSKKELEEFNEIWPTIYFHEQSDEHIRKLSALSPDEVSAMQHGIEAAIQEAKVMRNVSQTTRVAGAVVLDPSTGETVSSASAELGRHDGSHSVDLLRTPVLLAIQGVSRIERAAAMGHGMDSEAFKNGQYLCTGYDLYTTMEPTVFEAMACVHSRMRRVVFGIENVQDGGLGGTSDATAVHSLPGTNHHYRAFACQPGTLLWKTCEEIHDVQTL